MYKLDPKRFIEQKRHPNGNKVYGSDSSSLAGMVITLYTTIRPTNYPGATNSHSISVISDLPSTTASSSSAGLSSNSPESTRLTSSILPSSLESFPLPSATSNPTALPELFGPKQKFNDTFAYVVLSILIILAVSLLGMIGYLIYLRCKGKCPKCNNMENQLRKWESGELKRITPYMVRQREEHNKAVLSSDASSKVDLELGTTGHEEARRAAGLAQLQANKKRSSWRRAKSKISSKISPMARLSRSSQGSSPKIEDDRFFTVAGVDAAGGSRGPSVRAPAYPSQVHFEPNRNHPYASHAAHVSVDSLYAEPSPIQRDDVNGRRVFTEVAASNLSSARKPLRTNINEPQRYTAYAANESGFRNTYIKEHEILLAEAGLQSEEYMRAESTMKRASASDSEVRRALSIVNLRDQQLNIARHPSMYSELRPPDRIVEESPIFEQYEMPSWRKRDRKPREPEDG